MNVKEFVADTLIQVFEGVQEAIAASEKTLGTINPGVRHVGNGTYQISADSKRIVEVDFDIAVTVESSGGGKAAVTVLGVDIGGGGSISNSTVSRVKFHVPITMPATKDTRRKAALAESA